MSLFKFRLGNKHIGRIAIYEAFPLRPEYQYNILSGFKLVEDSSYFGFTKIFRFEVWLILAISILLTWKFSRFNTEYKRIFDMNIFATLLFQQSTSYFAKLPRNNKSFRNTILIISITIWLISAMIITKSFTELLFNIYFNTKLVPIVENFHYIYGMKNLEIQCKDDCSRIVKDLDYTGIDVQILDDIHKRSKEYYTSRRLGHSSFQLRLDHLVQVINGNAVYISFTHMFDALNNINYKFNRLML